MVDKHPMNPHTKEVSALITPFYRQGKGSLAGIAEWLQSSPLLYYCFSGPSLTNL